MIDDGGLVPDGLDGALVLVRHGQSTYIEQGRFQGQADPPLSATGEAQAAAVGGRIARRGATPALPLPAGAPDEIVHSPLSRATQTAEAIAAALSASPPSASPVPVRPEAGLMEIGQGTWEGMLSSDIAATHGAVLAAWRRRPWETVAPGGETLQVVAERVRPALARMLARLALDRAAGTLDRSHVAGYGADASDHPWSIAVAHDGVFKIALLTLFGLPLERFWMWSMDLCGITVVEFRGGRAVLRAHNLTEHLALAADTGPVERVEGAL